MGTFPTASRGSHPTPSLGECWGARARQHRGHFGWKREQGPPLPWGGTRAGANLRGFRTPGWKRTIPTRQVTLPTGMSPLWSGGMDAARGGILQPLRVGRQGLGGHLLGPTTSPPLPKPIQPLRDGLTDTTLGRLETPGPPWGTGGAWPQWEYRWEPLEKPEPLQTGTDWERGKSWLGASRRGEPPGACAWPFLGAQNLQEQKRCLSQGRGNRHQCTASKPPPPRPPSFRGRERPPEGLRQSAIASLNQRERIRELQIAWRNRFSCATGGNN